MPNRYDAKDLLQRLDWDFLLASNIRRFLVPQGSTAEPRLTYEGDGCWQAEFDFRQGFRADWIERHLLAWAAAQQLHLTHVHITPENEGVRCQFRVSRESEDAIVPRGTVAS